MGADPTKAAGIGAINFAFNGEKSDGLHSNQQDEIVRHAVNDTTSNETKFIIFKLVDTKKKGGTYIPNIDDVINPVTKKVERIRLLAGVDSIWQKDQKDITPDYIRQNSRSLEFHRGMKCLRIPDWDTTALEFARICRHNIGSPNRKTGSKFEFFEYNPAKQAQEALDRELLELDMAIVVRDMDLPVMKKHVSFLKINVNDELGELKTDDLLRKELMLYAKRNPVEFSKIVKEKSKEVDISYLVKRAILDAKIDIGSQPGRAFWSNGGGLIGIIPAGRKPHEYLTELALTNTEEGRQFSDQLNTVSK